MCFCLCFSKYFCIHFYQFFFEGYSQQYSDKMADKLLAHKNNYLFIDLIFPIMLFIKYKIILNKIITENNR